MFDVFHQPVELQNPVMSEDACEVVGSCNYNKQLLSWH
jgi:hypothetical protein